MITSTSETRKSTAVALVMTATVKPPADAVALSRRDPVIRTRDYCEALKHYLALSSAYVDRIVFIENSGCDLTPFRQLVDDTKHDKKVELIGCNTNDYPGKYGRAYGEFLLMDYGFSKSRLIGESDVFWKVTGRLRVLNLTHLIETAPPEYALYCDLRNVPFVGQRFGGNQWMEMRLYSCSVSGYNRLFYGRSSDVRRDIIGTPEKYLYRYLRQELSREMIVPRFRIQPSIAGYGAYCDVDYNDFPHRVKDLVRSVARRVSPWLWL